MEDKSLKNYASVSSSVRRVDRNKAHPTDAHSTRRERKLGPRGTVTEPGSPRGSRARAAQRLEPQCGPGAPPGRSRGIHPARPAPRGCLGHSPRGQGSWATGRGHRCARLTPGAAQVLRPDPRDAAAGEGRAGGRGRRRGRAGLGLPTRAVGPWPRPGCSAPAPSTRHPTPPTPGVGQVRPLRLRSARPGPQISGADNN